MNRRDMLSLSLGAIVTKSIGAAIAQSHLEQASEVLAQATAEGRVSAASIFVQSPTVTFTQSFGMAKSPDAAFLLGSISKPICMTALLRLYDQGKVELDAPASKYLPEFRGEQRERVTVRHLLTHVSGLPDQLPNNAELRAGHAPLEEFVKGAIRVPLAFSPGTNYEYSSMAIMLAAEIAQRVSGTEIKALVNQTVMQPLGMKHSALGVGNLPPETMMPCQVEFGAVESGGGAADSKHWDWNSPYWRTLGAPWGGVHASASDVGRFLDEFLHPTGRLFRPEVARSIVSNQNPPGLESRGLGFDVDLSATCPGCAADSFGHTGSTGTIAWADPRRELICVVLTTLPARAATSGEHPRQAAANLIAAS